MSKSVEAFRTIGEVAEELDVPKHVLRFWEGKFPHIRPMKRGGGRRYYRPEDMELLRGIRHLLHAEGYTIKGVQKILREQGIDQVKEAAAAATAALAADARSDKARGRAARRTSNGAAASSDAKGGVPTRDPAISAGDDMPGPSAKTQSAARSLKQDVIANAIRELELCIDILSGAPRAQSDAASARPASKMRASRS